MKLNNYILTGAVGLLSLGASAQTVTTSFNFTGGTQTFTVPCGVDSITISCWGAQGGTGANGAPTVSQAGGSGGLGGYAQATFPVNVGDVFNVYVGGQGAMATGGFNGGGNGGTQNAGGGGGASDVRFGGTAESNRIIVAGGGGGGGRGGCESSLGAGGAGGAGGGGNGVNGQNSPTSGGDAGGGFGGVGPAGGGAGIGCAGFLGLAGSNASGGVGGAGGLGQACCCFSSGSIPGGGGGGGGFAGGGGGGGGSAGTTGCSGNDKGAGGGGAGGTSYTGSGVNASTNNGIWLGNGMVAISYEDPTPSAAVITGTSMVMCANSQDTLTFMTPSDPEATFYTWTVDAALNFLSGQNTNTIMITSGSAPAGTYMVMVYAVNGTCSLNGPADSIMVTVNPLPAVVASATNDTFCLGGSTTLMAADSSVSYTWNPGNMSGMTVGVMPTTTTVYTVVGIDANGCWNTDSIEIVVNQPPTASITSLSPSCMNDPAVTLNGSPSGGTFTGPGVNSGIFTPANAGAGTHTITYMYTDANGCSDTTTTSAVVNALPTVTLGTFSAVCLDDANVTLSSGSPAGGTYSGPGVTGNSLDPTIAGVGTHTIVYSYTDSSGCSSSDSSTIVVNACVGISEIFAGSVVVAPNPAVDVLNLSWDANTAVTTIRIMDVTGKVVMTQSVNGGNKAMVDVAGLSAGNYSVSLEGADVKATLTFVKQ